MPAPPAYFDTSVLVKRYVREEASPRARALLRRYRVVSSALTPVEVLSALSRRRSAGEVTVRDFAAIMARIEEDRGSWALVEVSPLVLGRAEELVKETGLRTLDALHVASVLTVQAASGFRLPLATTDERQRDVAGRRGVEVVWAGSG